MSDVRIFEVGGHIRDSILGIPSNDIDYCVEAESYEAMKEWIEATHPNRKGKDTAIFLETPDKFTIRALKGPRDVRDYVLCRIEGPYSDGRRPDWVKMGTFEDDILRRDFTVNALAREVGTEEIIDIVGGLDDIKRRRLSCVGAAHERFQEDSLRIIRAIRFIIVKGFQPDDEIESILLSGEFASNLAAVSVNRRRDELLKCMRTHTVATLRFLGQISPLYTEAIFESVKSENKDSKAIVDKLWLMPTMKD